MLCELSIENLALFEGAALTLGGGLNAITGETGAGKSLLVDALEMLLGERPRAALVRKGAKEARVEGRFVLAPPQAKKGRAVRDSATLLVAWLEANLPAAIEEWSELDAKTERELVLSRALGADGRSRAWVNGRPVTQRVLRELASLLVEVHGQGEHQRLFELDEQLRLLDAFGGLDAELDRYRVARERWIVAARSLAEFEGRARDRRDKIDLLRFQARELADAKPSVDERRELLAEREMQRNASALGDDLARIAAELGDDEASALALVRRAMKGLERWEERIDGLAAPAEAVRQALAHLEEAAHDVERFRDALEYSPARLETVEQRLYALERLEQKYRTDVAGLVALRASFEKDLAALEHEAEDRAGLAEAASSAQSELERTASSLSRERRGLRARLKKEVEKRLGELGLEKARFDVRVEPRVAPELASPNADAAETHALAAERRFGPDGADAVEFLLAANPGEDAQPLRRVASGGEAARILLALRTALAIEQPIPTLVFDEIDSGVGGRLGPKVGEHLKELAGGRHQVVCVTHLPAIAALADHHFRVEKKVAGGRTRTAVVELEGDERVREIADMIAGGGAAETAQAEARRLLGRR